MAHAIHDDVDYIDGIPDDVWELLEARRTEGLTAHSEHGRVNFDVSEAYEHLYAESIT